MQRAIIVSICWVISVYWEEVRKNTDLLAKVVQIITTIVDEVSHENDLFPVNRSSL